jgi:hypothetical protein
MITPSWSLRCERSGFFVTTVRLVLADGAHVDFGAYPSDGVLAKDVMTLMHDELTRREGRGGRIGAAEARDAHRLAVSKLRPPPEPAAAAEEDLEAPTSSIPPPVPMFAIPRLTVSLDGLRKLPLDPGAGYLVSLMDGHATVEVILDACELERDEALAMLARLLQLEAIELRDP